MLFEVLLIFYNQFTCWYEGDVVGILGNIDNFLCWFLLKLDFIVGILGPLGRYNNIFYFYYNNPHVTRGRYCLLREESKSYSIQKTIRKQ